MANLSSSNVFGNLTVTGDISGDGFNIFNINAANISGIVASANLPSNNAYFLTPSDFWSPTQYFSPNTSEGWIGSVGSFRIGMGWNGYRNNSGSYTYSGVNGNTTTAGLLEHGPDGLFYRFGSTAGTSLPSIFSVNTSGTVSAPTFNATSTTNGGFQGIDTDSVTSPSFTWSGDLNTGIYRPAADQLGITTGGASRLIVQNTLSTFSNEVASTSSNSFRIVSGNYGVFWRNTGAEYYLLQTASGDQYGTFNSARPLTVNLATGIANINGNSATSTKWASGINLTIGSTAKSVDGSTNVAWSLAEIGAAAASHTHPYDNYVSWALRTDGTQRANITSGGIVNFVGGTNVTLAYSSTNNTITINSTDTNTTYTAGTGISIASNVITNTAPNVTTNLSYTSAAAQGTVVSSDGTNAVIPAATTSIAGLLTATDKTKLDGIATGAQVNQNAFSTVAVSGQSSVVADAVQDTLTLVAGSNVTITTNATTDTITISATDTNTTYSAGTGITLTGTTFSLTGESYTSAEKTKLAGIETGAQVNVGTNLGVTNGTTAGPTITSSTGTNVVFPTASATISGAVTTGAQTFAGTKTFSSTITGSITGNAGTVTNGVYTTGSYANPSWITSLDAAKLTGTIADARLSGIYSGFTHKIDGSNTIFTTPSSGSASTLARTVYGLAEFRSNASSEVGAIVFKSPTNHAAIMMQLEIAIMLYSSARISHITVQGYRSTATAYANLLKISKGTFDVQVRFATEVGTGKTCIILGNESSTWSYPHLSVIRAMFSHSNVSDTFCTGWTTAIETALTGYENFTADIPDSAMVGSITGSAATLTTARTINGTSFNGSANITTANWGTARTLTIGSTGKSVNGSGNVSWSRLDIGVPQMTTSSSVGTENAESCIAYVSNPLLGATDGALYSHVYSSVWKHQIQGDYRTGQIAVRGKNNNVWQAWRTVLDSGNFNSYAPTLTGVGATGTWGISVTGNAATVTNGVYTSGDQTIGGSKRFTSNIEIPENSWNSTSISGNAIFTNPSNTNGFAFGNGSTLSTWFSKSGSSLHRMIECFNDGSRIILYKNVGIGTSLPQALLQTGNDVIENVSSNSKIIISHGASMEAGLAGDPTIPRVGDTTVPSVGIQFDRYWQGSNADDRNMGGIYGYGVQNWGSGIFLSTRPTGSGGTPIIRMVVNHLGNVGIGTTSPSQRLQVVGTVLATAFSGPLSGNAATATTLQTARTINGTSFDGSANITTANWGTARTLTIGSTGKSVNGSGNVSWSLAEIGAADRNLNLTAGTGLTGGGNLTANISLSLTGQALALHNLNANGLIARTATNTVASRTLTGSTGIIVVNGDGVSGNPTIAVDSTVVLTSGNQTIGGTKTFNNAIILTAASANEFGGQASQISIRDTTSVADSGGVITFGTSSLGLGGIGVFSNTGGQASYLSLYNRNTTGNIKEALRIISNGNVGIGTITPGHLLEVNGSFAAKTKSFLIEHPTKENMKLCYGSLEGPENGVYVRGKLNKGNNLIVLPEYWRNLVDESSITVSLTPIGKFKKLFVKSISVHTIEVNNASWFSSDTECFYYVLAERKDVAKLQVEQHVNNL